MDIFLKEKFAPMSSPPTNELNEHVLHKERKFVGGCILSVLWDKKLLSFSFCLFCSPKMEAEFRVVPFFFICFAIQKVPGGVTNLVFRKNS